MSFKVAIMLVIPGITFGEHLIEPLGATCITGDWVTESDLITHGQDADAILCASPMQDWTPRAVKALSKCRIIATLSIGYDRIPLDVANRMGIAVTNTPDYSVDEVSTQAIALMLALARKLFPIDRAVKDKRVFINPGNRKVLKEIVYPVFRLQEQTLGIIGFGKIGTSVALKARGLGLRVMAYDPYVFGAVMRSHGVEPADFDTLLRESDFISVNSTLTPETRGMLGPEQFRKMKPTSYVINTARGEIIQQPALVEALKQGILAGAGLDVTAVEPIPADDPILTLPSVILTGHSAWYSTTADSNTEFWHKPMSQVVMAFKGEWPTYAVNSEGKRNWVERWGGKKP